MPVFAIKDQFGRLWRSDSLRGWWVILVTGARSHRDAMLTWSDSLHRNFGGDSTQVRTLVVADMRSVPGLMLRMAGQRAPREPHRRVLLDREGTVARQLGLDAETLAVVVVAPDGQVRSRLCGAAATRELLDAIRRLLATR